jgi:hypothetical protein
MLTLGGLKPNNSMIAKGEQNMKKYWTYRRYYWLVVKDFVLRKDSPQVQPIAPYRPKKKHRDDDGRKECSFCGKITNFVYSDGQCKECKADDESYAEYIKNGGVL